MNEVVYTRDGRLRTRKRPVYRGERHPFVAGKGTFDIRGRVLVLCATCEYPKNAPRHRDMPVIGDTADIIGQAVHDLTTTLEHRRANLHALDQDCRVLGRVIAHRLERAQ